MMTTLHSETTSEARLWERLQNILTATDGNRELVGRMIKDKKYVNAGFLQILEDNANSVINIVAEMRLRTK